MDGEEKKIQDYVKGTIYRLMDKSKKYQDEITQAKTKTKKEYFRKKLRKNNKHLSDVLMALQKIQDQENREEKVDV